MFVHLQCLGPNHPSSSSSSSSLARSFPTKVHAAGITNPLDRATQNIVKALETNAGATIPHLVAEFVDDGQGFWLKRVVEATVVPPGEDLARGAGSDEEEKGAADSSYRGARGRGRGRDADRDSTAASISTSSSRRRRDRGEKGPRQSGQPG